MHFSESRCSTFECFPENPGAKKCYEKVGFKERTLTENAFSFKDEFLGRCNMITTR